MVLKRIGVLSAGKISGLMYTLIGLLIGGLFSLLSLLGLAIGGTGSSGSSDAAVGLIFGVGAVIILPVFYGVMGFVGGLISAALYNLLAGAVGGLELEIE